MIICEQVQDSLEDFASSFFSSTNYLTFKYLEHFQNPPKKHFRNPTTSFNNILTPANKKARMKKSQNEIMKKAQAPSFKPSFF